MTSVDALARLGLWGLDYYWLPLGIWTLAAAVTLAAAGHRRSGSFPWTARLHRALLLALPAGMGLVAVRPLLFSSGAAAAAGSATPVGSPAIWLSLTVTPTPAGGGEPDWRLLLGIATVLFTLLAAGSALRLLVRLASMERFIASLPEVRDRDALLRLQRLVEAHGIETCPRLLVAPGDEVPFVYGWRRPAIVVPESVLSDPDRLGLVLAHELAHLRRGDVVWSFIEKLHLTLFVANPLVAYLVRRLATLREMSCDALVLSQADVRPRAYAELLLAFADGARPGRVAPGAIMMAHSTSELKRRIIAMKDQSTLSPSRPARFSGILVAGLFLLITLLVACTDVSTESPEAAAPDQSVAPAASGEQAVADAVTTADPMPEMIGGLYSLQQAIQYPEAARSAGTEGRVLVEFVVSETGDVLAPRVMQGVSEELDAEALRALSTVKFKPGMVEGTPVKVKMVVPIQFKLQ